MAHIGFIGLGNMGLPMAGNLIRAGHAVTGFDVAGTAGAQLAALGGNAGELLAAACKDVDAIVTMLPAGAQVREVYAAPGGVIIRAGADALLIDCSTIDVATARDVAAQAAERGLPMVDAPVSGGVGRGPAGTLTFMVGGTRRPSTARIRSSQAMGKTIVHVRPGRQRAGREDLQQHDPRHHR